MRVVRRLVVLIFLFALIAGVGLQQSPAQRSLAWERFCLLAGCAQPQPRLLLEQAEAELPTMTPSPTSVVLPSPTPTPTLGTPIVVPYGSTILEDNTVQTPTPQPMPVPEEILIARYGAQTFATTEEMPPPLRRFFDATINEVATYFEVRDEDLLALLRAQNEGALRVARPPESNERGVAQLPPRLWNGWAAPEHARPLTDLRAIEQYGGLGFDWEARRVWRTWAEGRLTNGSPISLNAYPERFANSVAALARYLVRHGLTQSAAAKDPATFAQRLDEAIKNLASQNQLAANPAPQPINIATSSSAVALLGSAFGDLMDQRFGVALSEADVETMVSQSAIAAAVAGGQVGVQQGATQLLEATMQQYLQEAQAARREGRPLPWPFAESELHLAAQWLAVQHLGHTLAPWELDRLLVENQNELVTLGQELAEWGEAAFFQEARQQIDEGLRRSAQGLPLQIHEVALLVQRVVAPFNQRRISEWELDFLKSDLDYFLRRLPEFRAIHGNLFFTNPPMSPLPRVLQPFGVPVRYQSGGYHTGIDFRGRRINGQQPPIHAVADGTVAHVGPLYCLRDGACRGPYAIILDHGNNVYTIYSHNSAAMVQAGEQVKGGQIIGRQGSEGYSRGPHLHLEVHVGAPYSGNWVEPWQRGQFVDPFPWLPRGTYYERLAGMTPTG